jgi:hypothetical protein
MSGSNSSAHGSRAAPDAPLGLTVHSLPSPALAAEDARRTRSGRWRMFAVLAVCAAPVIASYFTYFVVRPQSRSNYGELITPTRALPEDLPLATLDGTPVKPSSLRGQWLLVVVADAACDTLCEQQLFLQRQMRETLGAEKDRVDKLWLVTDDGTPRPEVMRAIEQGQAAAVLRVPRAALARWLQPAQGHALAEHFYIVDPMGEWMMREPPAAEPARMKRDFERLLRASASWDRPGR